MPSRLSVSPPMSNRSQIIPTEKHLDVLRSLVRAYGSPDTQERSLSLLNSRSGFAKWYSQHYGFPLDPNAVVSRRALRDGAEHLVASAAKAAGIESLPVLLCSMGGMSESTLLLALTEPPGAPPLMLVSLPLLPPNFVLFWNEFHEFTFSKTLWSRLRMPEDHWRLP